MSIYLKHIEFVNSVKSPHVFLNGNKAYLGVNDNLINLKIKKILNEKARLFYNKLSFDSPYADIIGVLCDYELVNTNVICGGYCNHIDKEISYVSGGLPTIFHEISHAIQADLEIFDRMDNILSKRLIMEQQCETMAYYLYNSIYTHKQLEAKVFDAYFCREHIKFLSNWCGESVHNDLIIK